MHPPRKHATPGNQGMAQVSMRTMYALPNRQEIHLDIKKPDGVPLSGFKFILDAHSERKRLSRYGRAWPKENDLQLLYRLASLGEPRRESSSDPLLWMLRVRWEIRKAAFSFLDLQPDYKLPGPRQLPPRPTTASISFRVLASWVNRHWSIQPSDYQLYHRVFTQASKQGVAPHPFQDTASGHWFLWVSVAGGLNREEAYDFARARNFIDGRRKAISYG